MHNSKLMRWAASGCLALGVWATAGAFAAQAADHGDAPLMASDAGADMADTYFFMDPRRKNRVTIIQTQRGFIVPGEAENLAVFDPQINYRLAIENSGDASSDINFNIRFSPKTGFDEPQIATIQVVEGGEVKFEFTAPTTVASSTDSVAPDPVVTFDPESRIQFFAGMVDDPLTPDEVRLALAGALGGLEKAIDEEKKAVEPLTAALDTVGTRPPTADPNVRPAVIPPEAGAAIRVASRMNEGVVDKLEPAIILVEAMVARLALEDMAALADEIKAASVEAEATEKPALETIFSDVYQDVPDHLRRQGEAAFLNRCHEFGRRSQPMSGIAPPQEAFDRRRAPVPQA